MGDILRLPLRLAWPTDPGAFRLALALLVFVHHFSSFGFGPYAVYVFFVLSGFWLHTMWVGRYARTRQPYLTYMVSRVWRLAPVMVLISAITIPLLLAIGTPTGQVIGDDPVHLAFSSTFLLGYSWLDYLPVGSAWSLDVEMQFYILAPFLAALLLRGHQWALLAAAALVSVGGALLLETPVLPKYAIFFIIGMVAASSGWKPSRRLALGSGLAIPALLVLVTVSPWRGILWGGAEPGPLFAWNPQFNVALAILTVPFAVHTVRQKSDATDRMFADLSYIIYLAHWVGMQWFFTLAGQPFAERLLVAGLCFAGIPLGSFVIWRFYDKPINRTRAAWVASRVLPKAPAAGLLPDSAPPAPRFEPAGP